MFEHLFITKIFIPILILGIINGIIQTSRFKGWLGETLVKLTLRFKLDKDIYQVFHNVIVPTPDGTTQIDHIIVAKFGVFVLESKHMKGWIFGSSNQAMWTQKIYRKSFKFQNPLRQNYKHTKAIDGLVYPLENMSFSVIVFTGSSTFKTKTLENVLYLRNLNDYIKSKTEILLTDTEVSSICKLIKNLKQNSNHTIQKEHIQRIQSRKNPNSEQHCPKCGNLMVIRTTKRGTKIGTKFWGCSQYPTCRTIRTISL